MITRILETVEIADPDKPGGKLVINRADFNPKKMTLWAEAPDPILTESKPRKATRRRNDGGNA